MSETKTVAKKVTETPMSAFQNAGARMQSLFNINNEMIEVLSRAGRTYFEGMSAMNEELLNFANERLAEASKTRDILMQCRDVGDVVKAQQDWLRTASQHYMGEASRLVDLGTKTMLSTVNPIMDHAKSSAAEIGRQAEAA